MLILKILKGNPTAEDWAEIGKMLEEGYHTGIDQPAGINWTAELSGSQARIQIERR